MWQRAFSKVWAAGGTHTRVTVLGVPPWDVFPSRKLFPCLRRGLLLWEKPVHASFGFCLYSVLTPLGCLLLGGGGDLCSGSRVRVCSLFPTARVAVPAGWAVFGSTDDPGVGISSSLTHFLSSLLPLHVSSTTFPLLEPFSLPAVPVWCPLHFHCSSHTAFQPLCLWVKSSQPYLSALKTDAPA